MCINVGIYNRAWKRDFSEHGIKYGRLWFCVVYGHWQWGFDALWPSDALSHQSSWNFVNIGSGNGLVPPGNKPLPGPMLTNHRWGIHLRANEPDMMKISIPKMSSKITNLKLQPSLSGAIELILPSAEEDILSLFDSKITCLCQNIKINNNKHVYRQSQVRKPVGSEVNWAECSLIIGTGCWVQIFAWSSIAQSVCEWAFSPLAIWYLTLPSFESCIQQRKTTCLLSFRKSLRLC